jgi:hypothetical protein
MSGYTDPWASITVKQGWLQSQVGINFSVLVDQINNLTNICKSKIAMIRSKKSQMSIADMFDLQMAMNKLTQFSEMSTSIVSAMNTGIASMARNMKG